MIKLKNLLLLLSESDITNESPIDTYKPIGDFSKGASFRDKVDRALVTNPAAIQKVKNFFKNTDVNFDLYFLNLKNISQFREKRQVPEEFVYAAPPNGLGVDTNDLTDGKINSDNITVFFTGNFGTEKIPLTPWIIAHRIGHVMYNKRTFERMIKFLDLEFKNLYKCIKFKTIKRF